MFVILHESSGDTIHNVSDVRIRPHFMGREGSLRASAMMNPECKNTPAARTLVHIRPIGAVISTLMNARRSCIYRHAFREVISPEPSGILHQLQGGLMIVKTAKR